MHRFANHLIALIHFITPIHLIVRRSIVLLLVCGLAGCSLLYSYHNIDRYIRWSLDDYIAWDSTQNAELRARLNAQLEWHRETQLPRYRIWLDNLDRELENDVNVAQLQRAAEELQLFWQDTMAHAQQDICAQLAMLSDKQVAALIATMREKQADTKAEYDDMSTADLHKKRIRQMRKQVRYWLGALNERQEALITTWAEQLPDGRARWLNSRTRWTDAFEQALKHRHEPELFATEIQRLFVTPQENWDEEYRDASQHTFNMALQLFADLHNARTPEQRATERDRIAQWRGHLDQLAH